MKPWPHPRTEAGAWGRSTPTKIGRNSGLKSASGKPQVSLKAPLAWIIFFSLLGGWNAAGWAQTQPVFEFSRLIIYDVRGSDAEETILIFDHQGSTVKIWMKNYLGERRGELPLDRYLSAFEFLRSIPEFALKPEYRGKNLRAHAAHGTVTLAWKDSAGKQIRTIKYYAPEHNLDDFRAAFNDSWALSRYAILSLQSLENQNSAIREDALYFLSGAGWLTTDELKDVMEFHSQKGNGPRAARALWGSLDFHYAGNSDFSDPKYLEYCVRKSMGRLGIQAANYLTALTQASERKQKLTQQILHDLNQVPNQQNTH
jgi:hypothetical protein